MATRKIMDCVDTSTNEKIYPKTHSSAVVTPDGKTMQQKLDEGDFLDKQTADQTYQPKGDYVLKSELTDNVAYPMESHTEATLEIAPNVLHVWGEMSALTITLGAGVEGRVNEYIVQFASGATATTLTLPSTLTWAKDLEDVVDGVFVPAASATYQVSIVNGLAIYTKF